MTVELFSIYKDSDGTIGQVVSIHPYYSPISQGYSATNDEVYVCLGTGSTIAVSKSELESWEKLDDLKEPVPFWWLRSEDILRSVLENKVLYPIQHDVHYLMYLLKVVEDRNITEGMDEDSIRLLLEVINGKRPNLNGMGGQSNGLLTFSLIVELIAHGPKVLIDTAIDCLYWLSRSKKWCQDWGCHPDDLIELFNQTRNSDRAKKLAAISNLSDEQLDKILNDHGIEY